MKKKLNEIGIANELSGSSVYFKPAVAQDAEETAEPKPRKRTPSVRKPPAETGIAAPDKGLGEQSLTVQTMSPPLGELTRPTAGVALPTVIQDQGIEAIRKAVKRLGKEASFCRFTQEEKNALADIIYTYKRSGVRTSENEVVRIAINWLIENYHADGQKSVLAQVLDRLNA